MGGPNKPPTSHLQQITMKNKWLDEWESLSDLPNFVDDKFKQKGAGPCPKCGGKDRFYITGPPNVDRIFMRCRQCGYVLFPDVFDKSEHSINRSRIDIEKERKEKLKRIEAARRQLAYSAKPYKWAQDELADISWLKRGVRTWARQQYVFGIGTRKWDGGLFMSLTIPYWRLQSNGGRKLIHLQHRFIEWIRKGNSDPPRYSPHIKNLSFSLWYWPLYLLPTNKILLVEGAIKAAVVAQFVNLHVVASMNIHISWIELEQMKEILDTDATIYYLPDPIANDQQKEIVERNVLAMKTFANVQMINFDQLSPTYKIDDMLNPWKEKSIDKPSTET